MDDFSISDEYLFHIHHAIERSGFYVTAVQGTPSWPSWAYTIGLLEHDHPELVTVGLSAETAHAFLTLAYQDIVDGQPFPSGREHRRVWRFADEDMDDLPVSVVDIQRDQWCSPSDLMAGWINYYGARGGFPSTPRVCQLVWPDGKGLLPWDPGYHECLRTRQLLLDDTRWEHDRPHDGECGPGCDLWGRTA